MCNWYTQDRWKAYVSWFSPPWAMPRDEFDAGAWADKLERGGFRVVVMHVKHHDGVCFYPSKYRVEQPERDFFGEFAAEAHRRGMHVVAYYSVVPDEWSAREHPDWCCVHRDGTPVQINWSPFPIGVCCVNNPGYRELVRRQLEEVQTKYNTDGFWLDIFWNDSPCFCQHCERAFLEHSGGKALREQWPAAGPASWWPLSASSGIPDELWLTASADLKLWWRDSFLSLFRDVKKIASRDGAERPVTYNLAGRARALGYERIDEECATHSVEAHDPLGKSLNARLLDHRDKPFEFYSPGAVGVDCWTFRPVNLLLLEAAIVGAHGGSLLTGFDVRPSGYFSGAQMDVLGEIGSYLRAREPYFAGSEPLYDAGVLLARGGARDLEIQLGQRGGWPAALLADQVAFAILAPETDDLAPYRLVIVDEDMPMDGELAGRLENYVEQGGNLIGVQDAAGFRDRHEDFLLSGVLGIEPERHVEFESVYLDGIDRRISSALGSEPVRSDGRAWKIRTVTAEPLAYYTYPIARWSRETHLWAGPNPPGQDTSRDAAVTLNRFGRGKAVYVGCPLRKFKRFESGREDSPNARELLQVGKNLAAFLIEDPLIRSEAPSAVEVVVNRQGNRYIVHFLNHYAGVSSLHDRAHAGPVLSDVGVWLNQSRIGRVKRIIPVPCGEETEVETDGNWVRVAVPQLGIHEMVMVCTTKSK